MITFAHDDVYLSIHQSHSNNPREKPNRSVSTFSFAAPRELSYPAAYKSIVVRSLEIRRRLLSRLYSLSLSLVMTKRPLVNFFIFRYSPLIKFSHWRRRNASPLRGISHRVVGVSIAIVSRVRFLFTLPLSLSRRNRVIRLSPLFPTSPLYAHPPRYAPA